MPKTMKRVKNNYTFNPNDNTCTMLVMSKGKQHEFTLDHHVFPAVSDKRWSMRAHKYLESRTNGEHVHLHQYLVGGNIPKGMEVDHINGDQFDNRIDNLRVVTHQENMFNMKSNRNSFSRYKGVYKNQSNRAKGVYAQINNGGRKITIGHFHTEEEAAKAYDKKAIELFGEYAKLNFPSEANKCEN